MADETTGSELIKLILVGLAFLLIFVPLFSGLMGVLKGGDDEAFNNFNRMIDDIKDAMDSRRDVTIPLNFGDYVIVAYDGIDGPKDCNDWPCICLEDVESRVYECSWRYFENVDFDMKELFFSGEVTLDVKIKKEKDKTYISLERY